jgi:hypothetical protein
MNLNMEQLLAALETAHKEREPLSAAFAVAKQEAKELAEAQELASGAGTAEEQEQAKQASIIADKQVKEAEAALQAADLKIAEASKAIERLEQAMNEDQLRQSARDKNDMATEADPQAKETWLLVTATEFAANHPYDGTTFNQANAIPHVNDKWVREQVEAGLLVKRGSVKG